jgi:hypothetical protein
MKTITEIFSSNPELLETKEVKELIEQFRVQFLSKKLNHHAYWNKITTLTMNSELFVINGTPCKQIVEDIHNLSFDVNMTP